jgi:hypothetical protein
MFVRLGDAYRLSDENPGFNPGKKLPSGSFVSLYKTAQLPRSELARVSRSSAGVEGERSRRQCNREVPMGSFKRPRVFQPLDLEIIDRVYETVWVHLEACEPFRDRQKDGESCRTHCESWCSIAQARTKSTSTRCAIECWLVCPTPGWCSRVVSLIGHQKSAHKF